MSIGFDVGNYHFELPSEYKEEYRKLNIERSEEIKENMKWAWSKYFNLLH